MKWEQGLQDKYGLSNWQLRIIKDIFIHTMIEMSDELFACKDFIPEGQSPLKNIRVFVERCWNLGGVELLNSANEVWQNRPPTNSAARYSAWMIDLIIRQVLEQITQGSPQSATDLYTKTSEPATLSDPNQSIQRKLIEIEKLRLKIEDKQSQLKLLRKQLEVLKLEKQVCQLELTNQRLALWSSRWEDNSSSRSFLPKLLIGALCSTLLFFTLLFVQALTSSDRQSPDTQAVLEKIILLKTEGK